MRKRIRLPLWPVLMLCVFAYASGQHGIAALQPAEVAIPPLADAYVRAGIYSAQNFGTAKTLTAKKGVTDNNTRRSYLMFDISAVGDTDRVMLRLYGRLSNIANQNVKTTVYAVADTTWGENTVTWNTRPNLGTVLGTFVIQGTTPQWINVDVTKYVRSEKAAGRQVISVALRDLVHASPYSIFNSREAAQNAPALIIVPTT
jgi:endoglucanase